MRAAREAGHEVSAIGVSDSEAKGRGNGNQTELITTIELFSRKLRFLPQPIRHIISAVELMLKQLPRGLKSKPTLIHCNDTIVLPLSVLLKMLTGAVLVYDAHELESNRNGLSRAMAILTLYTEKTLWRFVDSLIVVSPSIEEWYVNHIGAKKSCIILNSPMFTGESAAKSNYLRDIYRIPNETKVFIYIGIIGRGRGIELLLNVFAQPTCKACIVFLGYGEYSDKVKVAGNKCSNIHIHPVVPHEQVVGIARSADFGFCLVENVSLSDYYSLPNKLFEYAFAKIPIIASNFPDIRKIVKAHDLGVCVDLSSNSISRAVDDIIETATVHRVESIHLEELGWGAQAEKLMALYREIIN
jgi:glycosyltransferase involved in cell wall biosynthesis